MKVCMIGLGSIGQRHLKNLILVSKERNMELHIDALRNTNKTLPEDISKHLENQYISMDQLGNNYDVIFICNPTVMHFSTLKQIEKKTKHCFIEKPVFDKWYNIADLMISQDRIFYVACPLRHKKIIFELKKILENTDDSVICARAITSSYLPNWRQNSDYRTCYSAIKKMGGGVVLDLIHEWDYLSYLFGFPNEVHCLKGHYSDLEIDTDDCAVYIANYKDKLVEVHLDYFGQKDERVLQLFLNHQRIDVNLIENRLTCYMENTLVKEVNVPKEDFYMNEMRYFFDCMEKKKANMNTIYDANDLLKRIC